VALTKEKRINDQAGTRLQTHTTRMEQLPLAIFQTDPLHSFQLASLPPFYLWRHIYLDSSLMKLRIWRPQPWLFGSAS